VWNDEAQGRGISEKAAFWIGTSVKLRGTRPGHFGISQPDRR
jgi:hypothetical protein